MTDHTKETMTDERCECGRYWEQPRGTIIMDTAEYRQERDELLRLRSQLAQKDAEIADSSLSTLIRFADEELKLDTSGTEPMTAADVYFMIRSTWDSMREQIAQLTEERRGLQEIANRLYGNVPCSSGENDEGCECCQLLYPLIDELASKLNATYDPTRRPESAEARVRKLTEGLREIVRMVEDNELPTAGRVYERVWALIEVEGK